MCAGLAVLLVPPSVVLISYFTWNAGHSVASDASGSESPSSLAAVGGGVLAAAATWSAQSRVVFPLVDEGGPLSLAKVSSTLGEPLKIRTWREFYRSAGPPTATRCVALGAAFFAGGAASGAIARSTDARRDDKRTSDGER
jgi:hypothetical protein